MSIGKSDNDVLIQMALQGMVPILARRIQESPKFKGLILKIAEAEQGLKDAHAEAMAKYSEGQQVIEAKHAEGLRLYAEFREEISDLLSANGLQFLIDEYKAAQPAAADGPNRPSALPPHTPVG